jgi:hypothetical protein
VCGAVLRANTLAATEPPWRGLFFTAPSVEDIIMTVTSDSEVQFSTKPALLTSFA